MAQNPCIREGKMYREENRKQHKLEDFYLPFGGHLDEENRWVVLSKKIPWAELESDYAETLSGSDRGAPAKSLRMALGALMIKEKLQISDREVVEQIRETPYLQYFIGEEGYKDEAPFDPSMAGRNPSDCCSPWQPGWSISGSVWTVNCYKKRMKFYSGNIVKNNVKKNGNFGGR